MPLIGTLVCFVILVLTRTKLQPLFSPAERAKLKGLWMSSTLLRVLQEHPDVNAITTELFAITERTEHFFAPQQILGALGEHSPDAKRLSRRLLAAYARLPPRDVGR